MKFLRNVFLYLALLAGLPIIGGSAANATQILLNNTSTRIASAVGVSDTTINVSTGEGVKFALATGGNTIRATLVKVSGFREIAWEIVDVTARSSDVLTVTRAREGTTALAFSMGDLVDVRFTAGMSLGALGAATSAELKSIISDETGSGSLVFATSPTLVTPNIGAATGTSLVTSGDISTTNGMMTLVKEWPSAVSTNLVGAITSYADVNRYVFKRAEGTLSSPTATSSSATILSLGARGYNNTNGFATANNAAIAVITSEAHTNTAQGTYIAFATTKTGTTTNSTKFTIDHTGHLKSEGTTPALTSCGTSPALATGSSDTAGTVTMGTGSPTGCVITFATAYTTTAPHCVVTWQTNIASMQYTVSTTAITLVQTGASSNKVNYNCFASS